MADDHSQLLSEFISVTGVESERAEFYLQSANWELHTALETFYSNDSDDIVGHSPSEQQTFGPNQQSSAGSAAATSAKSKKEKEGGNRVATISQYQNDGDSGGEDGQAFYAGGSERSGQQIIGPNKKKNPTQAFFDAAKQHGAEVVDELGSSSGGNSKKKKVFQGAGFKLGSDVQPSQQVTASLKTVDMPGEPKNVKIKFWKNGFSVDNGPLRDFNDPENKDFLDAISRGEVPHELREEAQHGEVHVDMEDHREEDFIKAKETLKAFSGSGHTLGSPTPHIVQNVPVTANQLPKQTAFKIDESQPVTTIQIRLADGTRLISKFNHHNTIGDIRNLVRNAKPGPANFNLMTTFPNKVLSDDSVTITDAKLLNAVIVQRLV